jgi:ABC-type cobalamin transport system permease subunit
MGKSRPTTLDIICRALFLSFLLSANQLFIKKFDSTLFTIMAIVILSLPEVIQLCVESKEKKKFALGIKQAIMLGMSVFCIALTLITPYGGSHFG